MRVGHRLFLAVLPAIIGLLTVAGLAYFGEYAHEAPEWLVALALVASLGSAVLAWRNARYVTLRIEQLAAGRLMREETSGVVRRATEMLGAAIHPRAAETRDSDELDRIERLLEQLTETLEQERSARATLESSLEAREKEYTALVDDAVTATLLQLEEVRLPLHILLENRFGDLNENQEEMLGAARTAAESADATLLRLREVVRLPIAARPSEIAS